MCHIPDHKYRFLAAAGPAPASAAHFTCLTSVLPFR